MRAHAIRLLVGVALSTVLTACAEPQLQGRDTAARDAARNEGAAEQRVAELAQELEAVSRNASRMEELYAAREAEILALRAQVASLTGD